ncbi:MAG: hypothetical protein R3280_05670 [Marinobacter sp.]|uniref:hypothetical protein n=1 Tax=Marinobacter sp. TaxID=50741 RepID=UPI00299D6724|nr:hypothetical protein [Marinobacter sp.]MDX1634101.1 hypothetical protein [Marinobacter sp.]
MNEPLPDLRARFLVKRGLFRKERIEAALYDLDEYGCVFKTDRVFEPGDTLTLDLVMAMPFDDIQASGLNGLVTERRKHCSNFFYSVDFIGLDSRPKAPDSEKLDRIREVLSKKQSLRSRRGSPSSLRQTA